MARTRGSHERWSSTGDMHSDMDANVSALLPRLALASAVLVLSTLATTRLALSATASRANRPGAPWAHAVRILDLRDEGHLHFIRSSGALLVDEGHATGSFPGQIKARFVHNDEPNVTVFLTISSPGGPISVRGEDELSSPTSSDPSFKGRMRVLGGNGRYGHIHGAGELFGVFNRRSYELTVQVLGKLPY